MIKYAVVEFFIILGHLGCNVIRDNFTDIKEAEKYRIYQLNLAPIEYTLCDPQMLQVIQYVD